MVGLDSAAVATDAMRSERATRWLKGIGWLAAALAIGLGGGGVAAFGDHPATDATRPELTARADAETLAAMGPLQAELTDLRTDVTRLGRLSRAALGALNARDADLLQRTISDGDDLLTAIAARGSAARLQMRRLPYEPTSDRLGQATRERLAAAERAIDAVQPVILAWQGLADRARPAGTLISLLDQHDKVAFRATQRGVEADYAAALDGLEQAIGVLDRAQPIRDLMAPTVDTETLDQWLERNRAYDEALQKLYRLLDENGGQPSPDVSAAYAEVARTQELLPPDTRALVVIMADVAQGGLNQAALAIEQARGRLASATSALH
jgi:hypothetical protein